MNSRVTTTLRTRAQVLDRVRGHKNTLLPFLARSARPAPRPPTQLVRFELEDPDVGPVRLTGAFLPGSRADAVVVIHGLGGSALSGYMGLALSACAALGRPCLLLNTRGSDLSGQDIPHAGLWADLEAALRSPLLADVPVIDVLGYSLGGQLALKYAAASELDTRVRRVAAIGSPLLLSVSAAAFDRPSVGVYRRHVLDSLKKIYAAAYQRNPRGITPEEARRIDKIRDWDDRVVARRFGFPDADAYYQAVSSGFCLAQLRVDCLYVGATFDPMVPPTAVAPALPAAKLSVYWDECAGHLGFGLGFDLGLEAPLGLESQVLAWLEGAAARA